MSRYIEYHIALSFAGEDRGYVEEVANILKSYNLKIFYDKFEKVDLWGKNLYDFLSDIYQNKALYTIMFISKHYAKKLWTTHERHNIQARAFEENYEYILPARFDDTTIPGLPSTIGYVSLKELTPKEFSTLVLKKLKNSSRLDPLEISKELAFSEIKKNLLSQTKIDRWHPNWAVAKHLIDELSGIELLLLLFIDRYSLGHMGKSYTEADNYINFNILSLVDGYKDLKIEEEQFESLDLIFALARGFPLEKDFIPPDKIEAKKLIKERGISSSFMFEKLQDYAFKLNNDPQLDEKLDDYYNYRKKVTEVDKIKKKYHIDLSIILESLSAKNLIKEKVTNFTRNPPKVIVTTNLGKLVCSYFKLNK